MIKYTKPEIKKVKTINVQCIQKSANCSGLNAREMPNTSFTRK